MNTQRGRSSSRKTWVSRQSFVYVIADRREFLVTCAGLRAAGCPWEDQSKTLSALSHLFRGCSLTEPGGLCYGGRREWGVPWACTGLQVSSPWHLWAWAFSPIARWATPSLLLCGWLTPKAIVWDHPPFPMPPHIMQGGEGCHPCFLQAPHALTISVHSICSNPIWRDLPALGGASQQMPLLTSGSCLRSSAFLCPCVHGAERSAKRTRYARCHLRDNVQGRGGHRRAWHNVGSSMGSTPTRTQ